MGGDDQARCTKYQFFISAYIQAKFIMAWDVPLQQTQYAIDGTHHLHECMATTARAGAIHQSLQFL
jgi:hypothetical protein